MGSSALYFGSYSLINTLTIDIIITVHYSIFSEASYHEKVQDKYF